MSTLSLINGATKYFALLGILFTDKSFITKGFIKQLKKTFPELPVYEHDERFTSSMALQTMIAMGSKKSDRRDKSNIDKMSATIILQSFLEIKR